MNERKFLIRNANKARDLIKGKLIITPKDKHGDLVTNFDTKIEKFLIKKIKRSYPDFDIISEEENSSKKLSQNCFVIDPIDGTNNFARKIPMWGIQMACIRNGETVASVIYLPVYDELYSADKSGAYLNDEKIHVNQQNEKIGVYTVSGKRFDIQNAQNLNPNYRHFGSACFSLSLVACGKISASFYDSTIKPWDYIPGEYLVKQAGGLSLEKDGIKIFANKDSWLNIIPDKKQALTPSILSQIEKKYKDAKILQENIKNKVQPKVERKIEEAKKATINLKPRLEKTLKPLKTTLDTVKSETKNNQVPNYFHEQSETIIETFKIDIPESEKSAREIIDEYLVELSGKKEKKTTNSKSTPKEPKLEVSKNTVSSSKKPAQSPKTPTNTFSIKSPKTNQPIRKSQISLSEAKKRKIIM